MRSGRSEQRGVTLIELLVVLVLVGLLTTLATFAMRRGPDMALSDGAGTARLRAVTEGRPVAMHVVTDSGDTIALRRVRYLPDGRAVGSGVEPLTGRPVSASPAREPETAGSPVLNVGGTE